MSRIALDANVTGVGRRAAVSNSDGPRSGGGAPFAQHLQQARRAADDGGLFGELRKIEARVAGGTRLTPEELLTYQMKIGKFGLGIELISKVADGAVATVRKLSNG